jgi:hypothetical protein
MERLWTLTPLAPAVLEEATTHVPVHCPRFGQTLGQYRQTRMLEPSAMPITLGLVVMVTIGAPLISQALTTVNL